MGEYESIRLLVQSSMWDMGYVGHHLALYNTSTIVLLSAMCHYLTILNGGVCFYVFMYRYFTRTSTVCYILYRYFILVKFRIFSTGSATCYYILCGLQGIQGLKNIHKHIISILDEFTVHCLPRYNTRARQSSSAVR